MGVVVANRRRESSGRGRLTFDPFEDLNHYARLCRKKPKLGIFTLGGGVPRNWAQQVGPYLEILRVRLGSKDPVRRYRYARELTHPDVEVLADDAERESLPRIGPRYSAVEGLPPRTLRRIVESAVEYAADLVDSYVPESSAALN